MRSLPSFMTKHKIVVLIILILLSISALSEFVMHMPSGSAFMQEGEPQIAYDQSSSTSMGFGYAMAWSHTTGNGENRLLTVGLGIVRAGAVCHASSVTYNGIPLTKQVQIKFGNLDNEIWTLTNQTVGTYTIMVMFNTYCTRAMGGASSYFGVNQTTPIGATASNSGTTAGGSNCPITTTKNDSWLVDCMIVSGASGLSAIPASPQRERWKVTRTEITGSSDMNATIAKYYNLRWYFFPTAYSWCHIAIEVIAFFSSPDVFPTFFHNNAGAFKVNGTTVTNGTDYGFFNGTDVSLNLTGVPDPSYVFDRFTWKEDGDTLLVDGYSVDEQSGGTPLNDLHPTGGEFNRSAISQSFLTLPLFKYNLTSVRWNMMKSGSPIGTNACAVLYHAHAPAGRPTGSPLAVSDYLNVSKLPTSYELITFNYTGDQRYELQPSTWYCITYLNPTNGTIDTVNCIYVGYDGSSPTHEGQKAVWSWGTWELLTGEDAVFYVYGLTLLGYNTTNPYILNFTAFRNITIWCLFSLADTDAPKYSDIGTNNTQVNEPCQFSCYWTDNVELDGYFFGTNISGSFSNDTFASLSGTGDWANKTKTLPLHPCIVMYQWWCNDTSDYWNTTGIQYLNVTECYIVSRFLFSPVRPYVNQTITFNGTFSVCSGTIDSYNWTFGDGGSDSGSVVNYSYTSANVFNVNLTVYGVNLTDSFVFPLNVTLFISIPDWIIELNTYPNWDVLVLLIVSVFFSLLFIGTQKVGWGIISFGGWLIMSFVWLFINPVSYAVALLFMGIATVILILTLIVQLDAIKARKRGEGESLGV